MGGGKTITEIRRDNLAALVEQHGRNKLAEKIGTDPNYLSQLTAASGKAKVGDNLARRIEVTLSRPRGWMDKDQAEDSAARLTEALEAVLQVAETEGIELSPRQISRVVSVLLEYHPAQMPDRATVSAYVAVALTQ